jgi:APA family basic amino acid/polyamine antiporter
MHGVVGKPPDAAADNTAVATSKIMLLMLVAMTGVAPISLYMLVPALPVLATIFGRDISVAQMTVSLYMVGIALSQLIMGPLSDKFGRRPVLLGALAVQLLAMVLFGVAHGVGALFAAAYGNVGSSIYYPLGVTAAFALGLTPVAFVISGLIFAATAATYAEATVMFPEAGGSSSFARHAFNELISFIAAWGQMLNYTITVAISAFFVPHYLAVFWPWLGDSPGDIIGGAVLIVALALINIRGTEESARLNLVLAVADLATQVVLVGIGLVLVFSPQVLVDNVHLGVAPTWSDFALGIAVGMIAYTGIETISNMAEEAKDAARTIPRSVGLVVIAVLGLYLLIPVVALSAMPVVQDSAGHYVTALGSQFADDPILGIVENLGLSSAPT